MTTNRRIPSAECTAYPWWAIICPDRLSGYTKADQRITGITSAVVGPFLSRESATIYLEDHRYRYGDNAIVYCMSGHESPDWRALCQENTEDIEKRGFIKAHKAFWQLMDECEESEWGWDEMRDLHKQMHPDHEAPGTTIEDHPNATLANAIRFALQETE